jgi:hypothetical protein
VRFIDSRCIHCGANLKVANDATHVCCQYCNAELHVIHDGDRAITELVREMQQGLGQKLEVLRVQNELERLDREWTLERESYMVTQKGGGRSLPSAAGSIIMGIIAVGFMIFWIGGAGSMGAPTPFVLFGVVGLLVVVFATINGVYKANAHETAEQKYQSARDRLLRELSQAEQTALRSQK